MIKPDPVAQTILIAALVFIVNVGAAVETNTGAQNMELVLRTIKASRSTHPLIIGNEPVLLMEPIRAPAVLELFREYNVYRLGLVA